MQLWQLTCLNKGGLVVVASFVVGVYIIYGLSDCGDLFMQCTALFYHLFYFMEDINIYDSENEIHMFALHYIYLPRINSALRGFMSGWNNHPLSSEGGLSPLQLWISGLARQPYPVEDVITEVLIIIYTLLPVSLDQCIWCLNYTEDCRLHGVDWNGPMPTTDESTVTIPHTQCPLTDLALDELRQTIDPLSEDNNYGIDVYQAVVQFIFNHYQQYNSNCCIYNNSMSFEKIYHTTTVECNISQGQILHDKEMQL